MKVKKKELNSSPDYDDRHIKSKIRSYRDKFCAKFRVLNVPEDDREFESFTVIFIDSLLVYKNKYYLKVYLDNCKYTWR